MDDCMKSVTLSTKEVGILHDEILQRNLKRVPVTNEYEILRVKDGDIFFILYKTQKLVYKDSENMSQVLNSILIQDEKYEYVIGTDETGKGEWYGPLVVEGVALTPQQTVNLREIGVRDSKTLSKSKIEEIGNYLRSSDIKRQPRVLMPRTYNDMYNRFTREGKNLNDMLSWAHTGIIHEILTKLNSGNIRVVIDKFDIKATDLRLGKVREFNVEVIQKSKGESEIAVATASILAKLIFEEKVDELDEKFGTDLRKMKIQDVPKSVIPSIAKMHFKNVKEAFES